MTNNKPKLIRITTVPISLGGLLKGQLKFMSQYYEVLGISSYENGNLTLISEKEDINVLPVEMTRRITPFKDLVSVLELYKVFKKEKPYIVHTHTPKAGTVGMLAAKLAGVPNRLHTIAGLPLLEATGAKRMLLDFVEKITYACASKIYPNSYGIKDIIIKNNYTKPSKLKVIGNGSSNGIDTSHFDPSKYSDGSKKTLKNKLGIDKNDFVYLFVGRLVTDKGINELVTAFQQLNKKTENIKLVLVGGYEKKLDPISPKTLEIINTSKNIISVGWQDEVRPYFSISDLLVFPSYREGFPNVVLQAGAMNLPSIVTNINGCNEIIKENENGLIIPVKDEQALIKAMKEISEDSVKLKKLSANSRKMIVDRYQHHLIWEALLNEYNSL